MLRSLSAEIGTLIDAIGTGIGAEDFDPEKARYHRGIIMTDGDVDGSHIRTLLLTFFFWQMASLIDKGFLYIAHPPLYRLQRGNTKAVYLKDDAALEAYCIDAALREGGGGGQTANAASNHQHASNLGHGCCWLGGFCHCAFRPQRRAEIKRRSPDPSALGCSPTASSSQVN